MVMKYKARQVSRGFRQSHGADYGKMFSPVVKFTILLLFQSIVAAENLELHQLDVKTAFLNGELNDEIYMEQPEGFVDEEHPEFYL